jgi:hypothetical protein
VEALNDSIGLRALGLGSGVVHILDREIELVLMVLGVSAIFRASVGQHAAEPDLVLIVEGHHTVVEEIGRGERGLAIIELAEGELGVGIDERLLVDAPDPLQVANIERVLGAAVARMLALELAMRLLLGLGLFQRDKLGLGQDQALPQRSWPPVL